jgi:hypothetical protein
MESLSLLPKEQEHDDSADLLQNQLFQCDVIVSICLNLISTNPLSCYNYSLVNRRLYDNFPWFELLAHSNCKSMFCSNSDLHGRNQFRALLIQKELKKMFYTEIYHEKKYYGSSRGLIRFGTFRFGEKSPLYDGLDWIKVFPTIDTLINDSNAIKIPFSFDCLDRDEACEYRYAKVPTESLSRLLHRSSNANRFVSILQIVMTTENNELQEASETSVRRFFQLIGELLSVGGELPVFALSSVKYMSGLNRTTYVIVVDKQNVDGHRPAIWLEASYTYPSFV